MDWITPFQALTSSATASYETLLSQWQELLGKVSRGELVPSSLGQRLPQVVQEEGTYFYRGLSALSLELFNDLSAVQRSGADDFLRGLVGDSLVRPATPLEPPPTPPPDADQNEWTQWSAAVTAYMSEQGEAGLMQSEVLLEKIATGKLSPAAVQEYARKFMNERALVLARDAGDAQMRFYNGLIKLNQQFIENLFAGLVVDESSAGAGNESIEVNLAGPAGSSVSATLIVQNNAEQPSEVSCRVLEFRNVDGTCLPFRAPLEVTPSHFRLAAGQTRKVSVHLNLVPEMFVPGRNYRAPLFICQNEQTIRVLLIAHATAISLEEQPVTTLKLTGPLGGTAVASLLLKNTGATRARVQCEVCAVRRADGIGPAFAPNISIDRPVFRLAPGGETSVLLSLALDKTKYVVGPLYAGVVHVKGLGASPLSIPFHITATKGKPARRGTGQNSRRRGRKRKVRDEPSQR